MAESFAALRQLACIGIGSQCDPWDGSFLASTSGRGLDPGGLLYPCSQAALS